MELKLNKFLEALIPDIKLELIKQGPKDFEQAVKIAENIEKALLSIEHTEINNLTPHANAIKELQENQAASNSILAEILTQMRLKNCQYG